MSARNRRGLCAYCRQEKELTRDHVPPKILFSKPCPPDMLTVPSCDECNQSFKANDEYTRAAIALDIRAASHSDVIGSLATLMRSLRRPEARGFARYFASQMETIPVLGPNGVPIQKLTQDVKRVDATGERIVR